jgi:4-methyl-5(b-hydroxyethyl)-thiazole monophosphate biosynthesis
MSKVLVPIAKGFEEIEAVSIIDICRRAGIDVVVAGVEEEIITGANGISIRSDCMLDSVDISTLDMIVLPGGWGGTNILAENELVQSILKKMKESDKHIGAICAAPYALKKAGVLNSKYTCYPSVEESIKQDGYHPDDAIVIDSKVITSRGPGTAMHFALEIVKTLEGEEMYKSLSGGLLIDTI